MIVKIAFGIFIALVFFMKEFLPQFFFCKTQSISAYFLSCLLRFDCSLKRSLN